MIYTMMSTPERPSWIRVKVPHSDQFARMRHLVETHQLHTVCESASCPNIGECWGRGTATFMILGNICSRNCRFCDVMPGQPHAPDEEEPRRVAEAVHVLALKHVVITSVTRDDLSDGGSRIWVETVRRIRAVRPVCRVEILIPDFQGDHTALQDVFDVNPDILGHNIETIPRFYPTARPQADYQQSLEVLRQAKARRLTTKSGVMLGMGETLEEVHEVMHDIRDTGCDILTLGQYLAPTPAHVPLMRYWTPEEFQQLREKGIQIGFRHVESGPLVRSSYHADQVNLSDQ